MLRPDISHQNIARVLRRAEFFFRDPNGIAAELRALADALDAAPTWEERVERAATTLEQWDDDLPTALYRDAVPDMLRAAFPELAPPESGGSASAD